MKKQTIFIGFLVTFSLSVVDAQKTPPVAGNAFARISNGAFYLIGTEFRQPFTIPKIVRVLGPFDRKVAPGPESFKNDIYIWDKLGIYAYTRTGVRFVSALAFAWEKEAHNFSPKNPFKGKIWIQDRLLEPTSRRDALPRTAVCKFVKYCGWKSGQFIVSVTIGKQTQVKSLSISFTRWRTGS